MSLLSIPGVFGWFLHFWGALEATKVDFWDLFWDLFFSRLSLWLGFSRSETWISSTLRISRMAFWTPLIWQFKWFQWRIFFWSSNWHSLVKVRILQFGTTGFWSGTTDFKLVVPAGTTDPNFKKNTDSWSRVSKVSMCLLILEMLKVSCFWTSNCFCNW